MRIGAIATVAVAATTLAACGLPVTEKTETVSKPDLKSHVRDAATEGPIPTRIRGHPFDRQRETLYEKVLTVANDRPQLVGDASFTAERDETPVSDQRLVVDFVTPNATADQVCADARARSVPPNLAQPGRMSMQIAYCHKGDPVSAAQGWADVGSFDDPAFTDLLDSVFRRVWDYRVPRSNTASVGDAGPGNTGTAGSPGSGPGESPGDGPGEGPGEGPGDGPGDGPGEGPGDGPGGPSGGPDV